MPTDLMQGYRHCSVLVSLATGAWPSAEPRGANPQRLNQGDSPRVISMNDRHFSASGRRADGALLVPPLLERPYVVVGELPEAMAEPGGRGARYWPVLQLIKDWNNQPDAREWMLAGGLPADTDTTTAAKVASVVHALYVRDGHPVPPWVMQARSPVEVPLVPAADLSSPFGQRMRQRAPSVCGYHRVYFSAATLDST